MPTRLDPATSPLLAELAASDLLVALDFDGTLSRLVADREQAMMDAPTAERLAAVCAYYPTAIVSGRARLDVATRVAPAVPQLVIGNHGGEGLTSTAAPPVRVLQEAAEALHAFIAQGDELEDKQWSMSLHLRAPRSPGAVTDVLPEVERALRPLGARIRLQAGHRVINILPGGAPNKGDAVVEARALTGMSRVLFVGDDTTDEDVFRLAAPWLTSVRIGGADESLATWYLPQQSDITLLLTRLVAERAPHHRFLLA